MQIIGIVIVLVVNAYVANCQCAGCDQVCCAGYAGCIPNCAQCGGYACIGKYCCDGHCCEQCNEAGDGCAGACECNYGMGQFCCDGSTCCNAGQTCCNGQCCEEA